MEAEDSKQEERIDAEPSEDGKTGESGDAAPRKEERTWAMFCHLIALIGCIVTIPFAGVVGPLVMWLIKKDEYPFVNDQGKEAVNFQISLAIYAIVAGLMVFILIGIPLIIALAVFDLVCVIIAAVKANEGVKYRYPLCIRFIK